jgi:hypothetical protein
MQVTFDMNVQKKESMWESRKGRLGSMNLLEPEKARLSLTFDAMNLKLISINCRT